MKIKFLTALCVCTITTQVFAQYVPNNSQAYQFMSIYNPAFSGVENFDDLKLSYRYQWAGFGEYSPKFINLAYHKRIKQPLDLTYNSLRISDFSAARSGLLPKSKRMVHALGLNVFQSGVGVVKSVGGSLTYAVHYPLTTRARLSFGLTSLIENRKLEVSEVTVRDPDEFYDYLLRSSTSQTDLNIRAGILFYRDNFYLGISYLPVVNIALQASELAMEEPFYRGSLQIGYSFPVNEEIMLKPSVVSLLQINNTLAVDYNLKAFIQNKVVLGLTYRDVESGVALLGFNLNDTFSVLYSFELSLGDFRKFDDGSHELVLAGRLRNLKKHTQFLW